jgi:hypothetical protein
VFLGATDLETSLSGALKAVEASSGDRHLVVLYIGDAMDRTSSQESLWWDRVGKQYREAGAVLNLMAIGHPEPVDIFLLPAVGATGGQMFDGRSVQAWRDFAGWIASGAPPLVRVVSMTADGVADDDLFYPETWRPGHALHVYGRAAKPKKQLHLSARLQIGNQTVERSWKVAFDRELANEDNVFLGRLWAQRKLKQLNKDEQLRNTPETDAGKQARQALENRIVAMSREWSVLTPLTAFLVLETEKDYERWDIGRWPRRTYWRPAGSLPNEPLPEKWLAQIKAEQDQHASADQQVKRRSTPDLKQLEAALTQAEQAIRTRDYAAAFTTLDRFRSATATGHAERFHELMQSAVDGVRRERLLERAGDESVLFAQSAAARSLLPIEVTPLFRGVLPKPENQPPHARGLLRQTNLAQPLRTLDDFAKWLADMAETDVVLDRRSLDEIGISRNSKIDLAGFGNVSLWSYLEFMLKRNDMALVEQPDRLLITSREQSSDKPDARIQVYPVADLLLTDRLPKFEDLLADPYTERQLAVEHQLREKLRRPVTLNITEATLADALKQFAA